MIKTIGIRREDKNCWEKRVPIVPSDVAKLVQQGIAVQIQPSSIRCFTDQEFIDAGATVIEDLHEAEFLLSVKEMPISFIQANKPHLFFSHTIKAQPYNMDMLRHIVQQKATLLDYERIVNEKNQRLIAFGRFAGLAGAIDALHFLGQRWKVQGKDTPFLQVKTAHEYENVEEAKQSIQNVTQTLQQNGWGEIDRFLIVIPGYGNVSKGVQEIISLLPLEKISASDIAADPVGRYAYAILEEKDMVEPKDPNQPFVLSEYYTQPEKYKGKFNTYLPYIDLLINTIYWEEKYPRLVTIHDLETISTKLTVIADISCDVNGSIECTIKSTDPGNPCFVYNAKTKTAQDGIQGEGVLVLAVDILPAEFSKDASEYFSQILMTFLPDICKADFLKTLDESNLPDPIKTAAIVWQGKLTPNYQYLESHIQ
ncbi:MAG TPA: bifunctional lysine ketoglutarate reductase /saccharopine dehydrogenase family protein [Planctomycetota bacterium]|nr:bifunctional lysine ketoglutarate reductase /saccharopine dehydrogenase family protein [Planctomycetota bacterium]HRU52207.1 bifunctional lysine ketoglutarate reductase /saccharopine dehydrogenase family protein [Planctomycetota bacterium]